MPALFPSKKHKTRIFQSVFLLLVAVFVFIALFVKGLFSKTLKESAQGSLENAFETKEHKKVSYRWINTPADGNSTKKEKFRQVILDRSKALEPGFIESENDINKFLSDIRAADISIAKSTLNNLYKNHTDRDVKNVTILAMGALDPPWVDNLESIIRTGDAVDQEIAIWSILFAFHLRKYPDKGEEFFQKLLKGLYVDYDEDDLESIIDTILFLLEHGKSRELRVLAADLPKYFALAKKRSFEKARAALERALRAESDPEVRKTIENTLWFMDEFLDTMKQLNWSWEYVESNN